MALFHKKERKQKQKIREAFGKPKTEDFDWNAIGRYSDRNPEKGFQKLSEKTFHDLNLNNLFLSIDRTTSKNRTTILKQLQGNTKGSFIL